ncbi:hypothetical protein ILYODFUR_036024 [Ilyodon furcidens]|uniref:Uncharacterized protein n=1 Tax=Ilyodon furcidens TaxID=33524 RepID=A0ABV0TSB1_9TELE
MGYSDNSTLPVIPNSDSDLNDSACKQNAENSENNLHSKQSSPNLPEKEGPTGPRTLTVGNSAVNVIKNFCNKKVMTGTSNVVSDISENILAIIEERSTLKNLIIYFGAMDDVAKKTSEVLKEDFIRLLNKVGGLFCWQQLNAHLLQMIHMALSFSV